MPVIRVALPRTQATPAEFLDFSQHLAKLLLPLICAVSREALPIALSVENPRPLRHLVAWATRLMHLADAKMQVSVTLAFHPSSPAPCERRWLRYDGSNYVAVL